MSEREIHYGIFWKEGELHKSKPLCGAKNWTAMDSNMSRVNCEECKKLEPPNVKCFQLAKENKEFWKQHWAKHPHLEPCRKCKGQGYINHEVNTCGVCRGTGKHKTTQEEK